MPASAEQDGIGLERPGAQAGREAARQQLMGAIAIAEREQVVRGYAAGRDMKEVRALSHASARKFSHERTPESSWNDSVARGWR